MTAIPLFLAALVAASAQVSPASSSIGASAGPNGFEDYKAYLMDLARKRQIREDIVSTTIPGLRLNEQAIRLDRAQRPGPSATTSPSPPLSPYVQRHVTPWLIRRGQERYFVHWSSLYGIQQKYGVDAATLVAIFCTETRYGAYTGGFDLIDVLASLAFEGRRRQMFETEFLAALELLQAGYTRQHLRGSYAGATGYPQFMPSIVIKLRADGDNDGYSDIWSNEIDALASIANYLKDAGWKAGVPWGVRVQVPAGFDRRSLGSYSETPGCRATARHSRWLPMAQWRALGLKLAAASQFRDDEPLALLDPQGPSEGAYLVSKNYYAILNYNCSNGYALSVALLSDAIARRGGSLSS